MLFIVRSTTEELPQEDSSVDRSCVHALGLFSASFTEQMYQS